MNNTITPSATSATSVMANAVSDDTRYDKMRGVLICGCIGDILGSQNEGKTFNDISDVKSCFPMNARYTDDTEMTIILAQHLIKNEGKIACNGLHNEYRSVIELSKRGYSPKTRDILSRYNMFTPINDASTNGGIMRISPLALIKRQLDDASLMDEIRYANYCTHGGCDIVTRTAFVYVKLLKELIADNIANIYQLQISVLESCKRIKCKTLYPMIKNVFNASYRDGDNVTETLFGHEFFQIEAIDCFICALSCFVHNFNEPEKAIISAANMGGDTDTIAKLTGEMVGAKYGYSWIPDRWKEHEGKHMLTIIANKFV